MIVDEIFQHFPTGFGTIIGAAYYYNTSRVYQLLGYHITIRFSVKIHGISGDIGFPILGESTKSAGKEKNDFI